MTWFEKLLKLKVFGSLFLAFASIYVIVTNIGHKYFFWIVLTSLFFFVFSLIQMNEELLLKMIQPHFLGDKSEKETLVKKTYPRTKTFLGTLKELNMEINALREEKDNKNKQLYFVFNQELLKLIIIKE